MTEEKKAKDARAKEKVHKIMKARIDQLCRETGQTYYTLSYKSSVPMTTLTHIIDGSSQNPGVFTLMKICDGLGVTMKEFFDTEAFDEAIAESRDER